MENKSLKPKIRFKGFTEAWEQRKLTDFVEFFNGQTYSPADVQDNGTLVLRSSNVQNGEISREDSIFINNDVVNTSNVKIGDIIVVVRNGSRNLIGKHAQIKENMPNTVIGAFMTGIRTKNSSFVNSLLNTPIFEDEINKNMGATINQITGYMFSNMDFKIPNNVEQQKIGKLFETIDNLITLHQRKCDKLVNIKKSLLEKMFPKNGNNVPEIRFKGFTEAWEQRKLNEISNIYDGTHQTPNYQNNGVMFLSVENIKTLESEKYISEEDFKNNFRIYPQKNDILMTRIGDIGTTNIVKDNAPKAYYVSLALIKAYSINPKYLNIAISSEFVQQGLKTRALLTAIPMKINKDQIGLVDVKYPIDNKEQEKIGQLFKDIDNLITLHQKKLNKLKNIKKSLLEKMFV